MSDNNDKRPGFVLQESGQKGKENMVKLLMVFPDGEQIDLCNLTGLLNGGATFYAKPRFLRAITEQKYTDQGEYFVRISNPGEINNDQ